jgi:hypothetical protein
VFLLVYGYVFVVIGFLILKKQWCSFFEWRSALGMRRVALASAESNAAPKQSEARSSPTRRETPKKYIDTSLTSYAK